MTDSNNQMAHSKDPNKGSDKLHSRGWYILNIPHSDAKDEPRIRQLLMSVRFKGEDTDRNHTYPGVHIGHTVDQ